MQSAGAGPQRAHSAFDALKHDRQTAPGAPPRPARLRRTLLECMGRRAVFRTLSFLSLADATNLLCADRRLRPFVNAAHFAPWRKRLAVLRRREAAFAQLVTRADDGAQEALDASEQALVAAMRENIAALGLPAAPTQLHEMVPAIVACAGPGLPPADAAQRFLVAWMLGRIPASGAFPRFDVAEATELLSWAGVFLCVTRLTRQYSSSCAGSYHQMVHALEADCRNALEALFAPQAALGCSDAGMLRLTAEQARFVAHDVHAGELVRVQAFAGTGKTQSLLAYATRRPQQRFLYIAFNAATAKSARMRFPPNVDCRTMHSVALQQVALPGGQALGNLRPRDVARLLAGRLPEGRSTRDEAQRQRDKLAPSTVAAYVLRTMERFMQSSDARIRADTHVPRTLAQYTDLSPRAVAEAAEVLWELVCAGRTRSGRAVPCPHDAYVKLLHLRRPAQCFHGYDVLLLDEAQDLSACQTSILLRARGECGVVVVGDVHQKIYGFRGGTATAFNSRLYPPSATFALTQSFRFGDEVAALASSVLGLKAPPPWDPGAPRPRLTGAGRDQVFREARRGPAALPVATKHARIYRTNARLTQDALALAVALPPGHGLFLKTSQNLQHGPLLELLRDAHTLYHGLTTRLSAGSPLREFAAWKELVEHVEAEDGGGDGKLGLVVSLAPMLAAEDFLAQVARLEQRFCASEDAALVVMTTVHQAKGLEWDRVVVADDFYPPFAASVPALRVQVAALGAQDELNNMYVALTRARRELVVPDSVLEWVAALEGLFRYRFTEKRHGGRCPRCGARKACLVQVWQRYAPRDFVAGPPPAAAPKRRKRTPAAPADPAVHTLGCLPCMRTLLDRDEDLEDFVHWIDACGVSATSGQLTDAAVERNRRKHAPDAARRPAKRRTAAAEPDPFGAAAHRGATYAAMLELRKASVARWFATERMWALDA